MWFYDSSLSIIPIAYAICGLYGLVVYVFLVTSHKITFLVYCIDFHERNNLLIFPNFFMFFDFLNFSRLVLIMGTMKILFVMLVPRGQSFKKWDPLIIYLMINMIIGWQGIGKNLKRITQHWWRLMPILSVVACSFTKCNTLMHF